MIRGEYILDERAYAPEHIADVLDDIRSAFLKYYEQMNTIRSPAARRFTDGMADFKKEQKKYLEFLDQEALEEYELDPATFKTAIHRDCPIIRRCMQSKAKVMEQYQGAFYGTPGAKLLEVTSSIVRFAHEYMKAFDETAHLQATHPDQLALEGMESEECTAYGVIGGGIRSHFLYQLFPHIFPNRSQNAVWALYFMTERKDYGFPDGSEFLMIQDEGAQQNYFYPYPLFAYYALQIHQMIQQAVIATGYRLYPAFRYVYVDTFLNFVAETHEHDINIIRPQSERFDY